MSISISRISALRLSSAALRNTSSRRITAILPRQCTCPTVAFPRGYATSPGAAHGAGQGSEIPWLISSVAVTALGLAFILSPSSSSASKGHSSHAEEHKEEAEPSSSHDENSSEKTKDEAPQEDEQKQGGVEEEKAPSESKPEPSAESNSKDEASDNSAAGGPSNPSAKHKSSQAGSQIPPPPADNADLAENREARKEGHEEYKKTIEDKQTRVASSSSTYPSKKTAAENPREDPQKGEGEGVQKGGPASSSKD